MKYCFSSWRPGNFKTGNCKMEVRRYIYYSTAVPVCDTGRSCLQPIRNNQEHKEIFGWTIRFFYCYI